MGMHCFTMEFVSDWSYVRLPCNALRSPRGTNAKSVLALLALWKFSHFLEANQVGSRECNSTNTPRMLSEDAALKRRSIVKSHLLPIHVKHVHVWHLLEIKGSLFFLQHFFDRSHVSFKYSTHTNYRTLLHYKFLHPQLATFNTAANHNFHSI